MKRGIAAIAVIVLLALTAAAQQKPITVDDVMDIVGASSPEISPDGHWIIYSRSELNWKDNKRQSSVWMISIDGTEHFRLTSNESDSAVSWSPDSKTIAFLSSRAAPVAGPATEGVGGNGPGGNGPGAGRQVWLIRVSGGEAWKLTDHKDGVSSFEWAPDGTSILFIAADARGDEPRGEDAFAVDEGANGQGRGRWSNIWAIDVAEKKERQVTKEQWILNTLAVSPDGRQVAVHARRENERNNGNLSEILTVDLANGAVTKITDNRAPESQVQWAPDGKSLSYMSPHDKEWELYNSKLRLVDLATKQSRLLSGKFEGSINRYFWSEDGKKLYFSGQHGVTQNMFELDVASGAVRQLTEEKGMLRVASMSKDLKIAAATFDTPQKPSDIDVLNLATLERKELTDLNPQVKNFAAPRTEVMQWRSQDGTEIEGILYLPAERKEGEKLPFILDIHGGPAGVWSYGFGGMANVYTGRGIAVLRPNVRGSSGYTDALLRGNMKDIGGGDYWDAMSGVDAVIARGVADSTRMAVRGWSYGGILGGWTITQTDRFKAASLGAMVTDWASEYAMGFNNDIRLWYIGGTPWENAQRYREQSSYSHIANVKTPTILFHGENDTTDTIGQSMMFYQGLKDRGVPVKFLRFPREPHGFNEPRHQRTRDMEEIAWLEKYLRGTEFKVEARK